MLRVNLQERSWLHSQALLYARQMDVGSLSPCMQLFKGMVCVLAFSKLLLALA